MHGDRWWCCWWCVIMEINHDEVALKAIKPDYPFCNAWDKADWLSWNEWLASLQCCLWEVCFFETGFGWENIEKWCYYGNLNNYGGSTTTWNTWVHVETKTFCWGLKMMSDILIEKQITNLKCLYSFIKTWGDIINTISAKNLDFSKKKVKTCKKSEFDLLMIDCLWWMEINNWLQKASATAK